MVWVWRLEDNFQESFLPPWVPLLKAVIRALATPVSFETLLPVPWYRRPQRKSGIRLALPSTHFLCCRLRWAVPCLIPLAFHFIDTLPKEPPPGSHADSWGPTLFLRLKEGGPSNSPTWLSSLGPVGGWLRWAESTRKGRAFRLSKGQATDSVQTKGNFLLPGKRELIGTICFQGPRPAEGAPELGALETQHVCQVPPRGLAVFVLSCALWFSVCSDFLRAHRPSGFT